jgi:hypothetical protein
MKKEKEKPFYRLGLRAGTKGPPAKTPESQPRGGPYVSARKRDGTKDWAPPFKRLLRPVKLGQFSISAATSPTTPSRGTISIPHCEGEGHHVCKIASISGSRQGTPPCRTLLGTPNDTCLAALTAKVHDQHRHHVAERRSCVRHPEPPLRPPNSPKSTSQSNTSTPRREREPNTLPTVVARRKGTTWQSSVCKAGR